jgi:hypothetical protein
MDYDTFREYYDVELPEVKESFADKIRSNKDALLYAGKYLVIPTGLFILTCIGNYYMNKNWKSL